jgi:dihydroxy-acid dehydratase
VVGKEGRKNSAAVLVGREKRRGYRGLYECCVNQAHEGADFDFLTARGPNPSILWVSL